MTTLARQGEEPGAILAVRMKGNSMTETERKALALVNEVNRLNCCHMGEVSSQVAIRTLLRAIEQHEAFRQEVSDVCMEVRLHDGLHKLARFIIAKPDPLVEALNKMAEDDDWFDEHHAACLRAALAARGGRIVFDGDAA